MRVIEHVPPAPAVIGPREEPIFLAGPIQGADDWQAKAVEIIGGMGCSAYQEIHVFNPRRSGEFDDKDYEEQIFWEQDHLARAARRGAHIFWFAAQNPDIPYPRGREYAKTTKKELGMSLGKIMMAGQTINLSVGFDPDYLDSERYFKTTLQKLEIPIHSSLENTCYEALRLLGI